MKGPRDPTHLTCTFVTAMEGNERWVKARITTSAGSLVEVREARNEAFLRARIEEIYPGIYYHDWTALTADELAQLVRTRGDYHPILNPLGL